MIFIIIYFNLINYISLLYKVTVAAQATLSNRLRGITTVLTSSRKGTHKLYKAYVKKA